MTQYFKQQMMGYDKEMVDHYIAELKQKNQALKQQMHALEDQLEKSQAEEQLVKDTLIEAQKSATAIKEQAKRDGLSIYNKHVNEAKELKQSAVDQMEQMVRNGAQLKASMLEMQKYLVDIIVGYQNYVESIDFDAYFSKDQFKSLHPSQEHPTNTEAPQVDTTDQPQSEAKPKPKRYVVNFPS